MNKLKNSLASQPNAVFVLLSALIGIGVWTVVVAGAWVPRAILPSPYDVAVLGVQALRSGRLVDDILASGARLFAGFGLGTTVGVLLGLMLGRSRLARNALLPIIEILRPIPPLAWVPLALIWLGIGEASKVFLITMTCCFPVLIATMRGVQHVDLGITRAAQSLDVRPAQMLFEVLLPASLPEIMTGLRLGWSLGLTVLVGSEMIAASSGLGHLVIDGMNNARFDQVMLGILVLGAVGLVSDTVFVQLGKSRLLSWHAGLDKAAQ